MEFPPFYPVMLAYKRKGQVTKLFEDWNKTEGGPKGLFFELGDIDNRLQTAFGGAFTLGTSQLAMATLLTLMTFSMTLSMPSSRLDFKFGPQVIFFSAFIHLYMNPSARQDWCRNNGLIFDEQVDIQNLAETILILTSLHKNTILRLIQESMMR